MAVFRKRTLAQISEAERPVKRSRFIMSALPARLSQPREDSVSPQEFLMNTVSAAQGVSIHESLEVKDFFVEYTDAEVEAYDAEVLTAIRSQNIDLLREFHANGRPLKCSNKFGESLLHLACRRGFYNVASFLILEAGVSVKVRDDYGRTVLHDAAWTCEPDFELIRLIVKQCPDLLYMKDRRGHTPTSYARQSHWGVWKKFISEQSIELFLPTLL